MPTKQLVTRYEDDLKLFPDMWHKIGLTVAIPLLLLYPFAANNQWLTIGNLAWVTVVGAVGMMLLTGFCGQISLGHAAFLAVGAYTTAILGEQLGMPFWIGIPIGGLIAAMVGLAVGPFALRLEGFYLAIVTLGLLFLVNHTLHSMPDLTHGAMGIAVPMHLWFPAEEGSLGTFSQTLELGPIELSFERKLYYLFLAMALGAAYMAKNVARSNTGRAMMAVRDHDVAAEVMGINPARAKITSFGLSSFFAGVAGGMFACQQQYITIEPPFDMNMSVQYIAIIVLGGVGTVFGAIWGAIIFVILSPLAENLFDTLKPYMPLLSGLSSAQQATLLFSIVVVLFLIFEPLGVLGFWLRVKRYFMAWPFKY
ncbi:MAG: branched-chain amino acid ABC transporter permease [Myxococcales bacterium]|nr:branched-chain amino acid ABC transporter permease [Myxococcales bacterium]